ncbi:MAG: histidine--tRNA ligase [Terriglobia bacterium]
MARPTGTIRSVKGTRDLLPPESDLWQKIEEASRGVFSAYRFQEIRTPVIEQTDLFARSVGADTDIVSKEMYTFEDRDHESLTLRPEATAGVVRACIEHGLFNEAGLHKFYYMGPMFRRERPQKGRYRQFYQIGAEALGSDHPLVDVETLEMLLLLLERLNLRDTVLLVNSVGCASCRAEYVKLLRRELEPIKDQMCADCQRRTVTNPLRVLDCKVESDQPAIARLPSILDHLCPACRQHFDCVTAELTRRRIAYAITPRLVRGLDYYTRTTFEITSTRLGAQNSLLGGGRYDGLSEILGGPPAPGFGFAIGEDRLALAVAESEAQEESRLASYIAWMGEQAINPAQDLARALRREGLSTEVSFEAAKLKKMLGHANRHRASFAIIIGEGELATGRYQLKNMETGEQREIEPALIPAFIKEQLGKSH